MQFKWGCVASLDLEDRWMYTLYLLVAGMKYHVSNDLII
jgi:hypothetical protein